MSVVLSKHLPLLASAPGGIQKLRGLILQLAVMGKLVPQDPNDEPASELLKRIAKERARLEAEGVCKKSKATPHVGEDEQPCTLPVGWSWIRLTNLGEFRGGKTPSTNRSDYWDGSIPWVSPKDMKSLVVTATEDYVSDLALSDGLASIPESSVLVVVRSGILRRTVPVAINAMACTVNQDLKALCLVQPELARYVQLLLKGFERLILTTLTKVGTTVESIKFDEFAAQPFPLPPLAEQHRIVAKVDELMALCDRLEAEQTDADAAHAKLVETLLGTLTQSTDAADLATNWQRLAEHFDTLFTTESSLDALKQTILHLAYSGRLTNSDSNKWVRAKLSQITEAVADIDHKMPKAVPEGVIFLSAKDLKDNGTLDFSQPKYISREDFERLSKRIRPKRGDIIYSRIGARLGKARLVEVDTEFLVSYSCCVVRPNSDNVDTHYLVKFMDSRLALDQAHLGKQSIGVPDLGLGVIKAFEVPVPPLAEQHRIVAKVDELMALCDRLKADLIEARSRQERLAATLIESALEAA